MTTVLMQTVAIVPAHNTTLIYTHALMQMHQVAALYANPCTHVSPDINDASTNSYDHEIWTIYSLWTYAPNYHHSSICHLLLHSLTHMHLTITTLHPPTHINHHFLTPNLSRWPTSTACIELTDMSYPSQLSLYTHRHSATTPQWKQLQWPPINNYNDDNVGYHDHHLSSLSSLTLSCWSPSCHAWHACMHPCLHPVTSITISTLFSCVNHHLPTSGLSSHIDHYHMMHGTHRPSTSILSHQHHLTTILLCQPSPPHFYSLMSTTTSPSPFSQVDHYHVTHTCTLHFHPFTLIITMKMTTIQWQHSNEREWWWFQWQQQWQWLEGTMTMTGWGRWW